MKSKLSKIYFMLILLFMYLPIMILIAFSFNSSKSRSNFSGLTLRWYKELFKNEQIINAFYTTILIALIASAVAVIIGVIASLVIARLSKLEKKIIMGLTNIPMLNADIVTGISLMILFVVFRYTLGFTSVLIAHVTFSIPFVILNVLPRLSRLDKSEFEAALDLGANNRQAFFKIIIPEIFPGIVSGFILSFTMSIDDFIITHFTKGASINTISTKIYTELRKGIKPEIYALSTVIFLIVIFLMIMSNRNKNDYKVRKGSRLSGFIKFQILSVLIIIGIVFCSVKVYSLNKKSKNTLNVYNWGEYIDPEIISDFEKKTGIKVVYEEYESNETMYSKVKSGAYDYDILCPSDYMIDKMRKEKLLAKIDFSKCENIKNIDDIYFNKSQSFDPKNEYSIPYLWGTLGIVYNKKYVNINKDEVSWDILWDKKYKDEIIMYDSVRDTMAIGLLKNNYSLNSLDLNELDKACIDLKQQKNLASGYFTDQCKDKMIGEEDYLCVMYSGDAVFALRENENLDFVNPKEKTNMWIDSLVITKNSKHKNNAYKFINYLLRDDVSHKIYEYTGYSSPNIYTQNHLLKEDGIFKEVLYPDNSVLEKCELYKDLNKKFTRKYSEIFKEIKSK